MIDSKIVFMLTIAWQDCCLLYIKAIKRNKCYNNSCNIHNTYQNLMRKELTPQDSKQINNSDTALFFDAAEDASHQLREEVLKTARSKMKGQEIKIKSDRDKFIEEEATTIVRSAQQYPQDKLEYKVIEKEMEKLKHYTNFKLAVFDVERSGSSSDQLEPNYQHAEDVIIIGAGAPVTRIFHMVGKITSAQSTRCQPFINIITSHKGAKTPQIQTVFLLGEYRIYKLTINSMIRRYSISAEQNKCKLQSEEIAFDDKQLTSHLLQKGFHFNFVSLQSSKLALLEELLIFSLLSETQGKRIQSQIEIIRKIEDYRYNLTEQLINTICSHNSLDYCFGLVLRIIDGWNIKSVAAGTQKAKVYRLACKLYLTNYITPFTQFNELDKRFNFIMLMLDIILENSRTKILSESQNSQLLQVLLSNIANKYQDDSGFLVLHKMLINKSHFLGSLYEQAQFVDEYLRPFLKNAQDQVAAQIMAACYYYEYFRSTPKKATQCIAIGIKNHQQNLQVEKSKNLILSIEFLIDILSDQKFRIDNIEAQNINNLLVVLPMLIKLTKDVGGKQFPQRIIQQIEEWIKKNSVQSFRDNKNSPIIQIISLIFIKKQSSYYFFKENQLRQLQLLLKQIMNAKIDGIYKKINEFIIIESIKQNKNIDDVINFYVKKIISDLKRQEALNSINTGVVQQLFQDEAFQQHFDMKILMPVINHFYSSHSSHDIFNDNWNHNYQFCSHINQKILEKLIALKKKAFGQGLNFNQFLDILKTMIQSETKLKDDQKQRMHILIMSQNLDLSEKFIRGYIKSKEKLYLKILLNILKSKQKSDKKSKVEIAITSICNDIKNKNFNFNQIEEILPNLQKDQERLSRLISENSYNQIKQQKQYISQKIQRLKLVCDLIDVIKNKFDIQPVDIVITKKANVLDTISKLKTCKVNQAKSLDSFPEFDVIGLNLCHYNFYFKNVDPKTTQYSIILQKMGEQSNRIKSYITNLLKGLDRLQISIDEYSYFDFHQFSPKQIDHIAKSCGEDHRKSDFLLIVKYNNRLAFYNEISQTLIHLLARDNEFVDEIENLKEVLKLSDRIKQRQAGLKISCQEYEAKFRTVDQVLSKLNIRFDKQQILNVCMGLPVKNIFQNYNQVKFLNKGPIAIIFSLITIHQRYELLEKLYLFKDKIQSIKEVVLNNNMTSVNLRNQDFNSYKFIMKIFEQTIRPNLTGNGSIKTIISEIRQISDNVNLKNEQSFNKRLLSLTCNTNLFELANQQLKNPKYLEKINIQKLINKSRINITLKSKDNTFKMQIEVFLSENMYQQQKLQQLEKYRDEAYILRSKAEDFDENQKKSIVLTTEAFLKMYQILININNQLGELVHCGYMIFRDDVKVLNVKDKNFEEISNYLQKISQIFKRWDKELKIIYNNFSSKATMLGGQKLKNFYLLLTGKMPISEAERYRHIAQLKLIKQFIKAKGQQKIELEPFECLQVLKQFFKFLKNWTQIKIVPAIDREDHYVQLFRFDGKKKDYIYCLNQMKQNKLKGIQEGHILACKKDSTRFDVQSFVQRALLDPDNQYIILGYDNLSTALQNTLIRKIEEGIEFGQNRLKLCVAGRETSHPIYRYLNNKLNVTKKLEGEGMKQEFSQEVKKFFIERINNPKNCGLVRIFRSNHPGLGKTHSIEKQIKAIKHKPIYFPISGRASSAGLYNRLSSKIQEMKQYSLVFQIYQIDSDSIDIVNDFIRQVVLIKSYQFNREICIVNKQSRIYLELQDDVCQKQLTFLNYIVTHFKDICVVDLKQFQFNNIEYSEHDKKLNYILEHLECYHLNTLDSTDLPRPQYYEVKRKLDIGLIKKHFVDKFPNRTPLTYYQYKYWIDLFYESCSAFTVSYQISYQFFKNDYNKKYIEKYKLQNVRTEFFKVLLTNSIEFLAFSIQNLAQPAIGNDQSKKNENNLSFFIVPNNQFQWFSFIYKDVQQIPEAIRLYFISQALLLPGNDKKSVDELQKIIFKEQELKALESKSKQQFQMRVQNILRQISGVNDYKLTDDPGYVINLDNFIKICLIAYKMKVNIPLVIQGEAGVGKTALLRHMTEQIYKYQFLPHTINAGIKQQDLLAKINEAGIRYEQMQRLNQQKHIKKKICIFFDEFNTLPELGYIKQIMMEGRFMGQEKRFFKNLVVFAACNPYRAKSKSVNQQAELAFTVKKPPLAMGQIMWNFGSLGQQQMTKYITKMLHTIKIDLPDNKFIELTCAIQNDLNSLQTGSTSLRDIQRLRQLYSWLKQKLPVNSKIKLIPENTNIYEIRPLRAFIIAFCLTYYIRLSQGPKRKIIEKNINTFSPNLKLETMIKIKKFEEDDFASRLKICYEAIAFNSALKQNLYCSFICLMKCIPILIVGNPGSSKTLAIRILADNFSQNYQKIKDVDQWFSSFPRMFSFYFQGSQSCTSASVQKKFKDIEQYSQKQEKNVMNKAIPTFIFDEMGLAQKSPDNPLKAIHEPLQLTVNTSTKHKNKEKLKTRDMAFIGISNSDLDMSKMSRFLVLRRPGLEIEDLRLTAKQIAKQVLIKSNMTVENVLSYLDLYSEVYFQFLQHWKKQSGNASQTIKHFFGLRDFYNLVKTFADLLISEKNKTNIEKIDELCDLAIYRNFSGFQKSYLIFKTMFFKRACRQLPKVDHNVIIEIHKTLSGKCRRYPLIIVRGSISKSVIMQSITGKFENSTIVEGSPFISDINKPEYVTKNISHIMKLVESDKTMIASSLNKTTEGALFDLFNKFFKRVEENETYRVALQNSGYNTIGVAHPNFNTAIIIREEDLLKESSAFLNRFQKYSFELSDYRDGKLEKCMGKIEEVLRQIEKMCEKHQLNHYKREHLFVNLTSDTIKSMVFRILMNEGIKLTESDIFKQCIYTLAQLSNKDFELLLQHIIMINEPEQDYLKYFKQGLNQKTNRMASSDLAVIISTDENIWRNVKSEDTIICLELAKDESQLKHQIKAFAKSNYKKNGILYVDFTRESDIPGSNINDKKAYLKDKNAIQVDYILFVMEASISELTLQKEQYFIGKVRIMLNYNRTKGEQFSPIPFMKNCNIFCLDGSSGLEKKKLLETVDLVKIFKNCMNKDFEFVLDEFEHTDEIKKILKEVIHEISNNQIFSECCKQYLAHVSGQKGEQTSQEIIQILRDPANLKNFTSIISAITKQLFNKRFLQPIITFIEAFAKDSFILNFVQKSKYSIMKLNIQLQNQIRGDNNQINCEALQKLLTGMSMKRIQLLKKSIQNRVNQKDGKKNNQQRKICLKVPTLFPFSSIETKLLFSPDNIQKIKNFSCEQGDDFDKKFQMFESEYNRKLQQTFGKFNQQDLFVQYKSLTRSENKYWKRMLIVDIVVILAQMAKTPSKFILNLVDQLQSFFKDCDNMLRRVVQIISNFEVWASILRILNCYAQNSINRIIKCKYHFKEHRYAEDILQYTKNQLSFESVSIKSLKGENFEQKMKRFIETHHNVYFQIENLKNSDAFESENNQIYKDLTINQQFLTVWESIYSKYPHISIQQQLKNLSSMKTFEKITIFKIFMQKILELKQIEPEDIKLVNEYLANKLFPRWFNSCLDQLQIDTVFKQFYSLCQKSTAFVHNSTSSVQIGLDSLKIDYSQSQISSSIAKIKKITSQNQSTNLKNKLFIKMCQQCSEAKISDNLSVLITNIFCSNLKRFNSLVSIPDGEFQFDDLKTDFENFDKLLHEILTSSSAAIKLFGFAYVKIYLMNYIKFAKPQDQICIKIDEKLCQKSGLMENLRVYCLKILRKKLTSKEIYEKYIKIRTFKWCGLMQNEMQQLPTRAIEVPKVPQKLIIETVQNKITAFMEFHGRDVDMLDEIVYLGSKTTGGRYMVLNFFMKYIYAQAYNKDYQQSIINKVKQKEAEYTAKLGKEEFHVLLRYALSKFDDLYFVQKHQKFSEEDFLVLNNINWMLASKSANSPVHSLFFKDGRIHESISSEISQSFIPCGPQSFYVQIAKAMIDDTRNCNMGVYICGGECDYMYSHGNCGWPRDNRPCVMCGQIIGSIDGSHKLARMDKGARRIMSPKFLNDSKFYIDRAAIKNYEEFWQAQRVYITAQINRMRKKKEIIAKPQINGKRQIEHHNLLGYSIKNANDRFTVNRISLIASKVIMLCLQSNLYAFVSLDLIKTAQYEGLFGTKTKVETLNLLHQRLKSHIKDIRQTVGLNSKFYTWVFGIQAEIYSFLMNFQSAFDNYVSKLDKEAATLVAKLKAKESSLSDVKYQELYVDMGRVIQAGLLTKEFKEVQTSKQMNARNQFTRQVFEEAVQGLISNNLFENKSVFLDVWYEFQGKMQFLFDPILTENKLDIKNYPLSRVLKTPSDSLTFEEIANKYDIIIKEKYPFLNYLLKNPLSFNILQAFSVIVQGCNLFSEKMHYLVSRGYAKEYKLADFNQQVCNSKADLNSFFRSWKRLYSYLGPIQVGCKNYGRMNDQFTPLTPVYNFLLDDSLKQNPNGQVICGIFNNYAILHNEVLNILKTCKNLIPKYRKMNFFIDDYKISPQKITENDCVIIKQDELMKKLLEASVQSIKYGENLVYHNFDFCQAYFLTKLKGRCELESNVEKYISTSYVGEAFARATADTNFNAIGIVREAIYQKLSQEAHASINKVLKSKTDMQVYKIFGEAELLINLLCSNSSSLKTTANQKLYDYQKQIKALNFEQLASTFPDYTLAQLIPLFEVMDEHIRPWLKKGIPDKYKVPMSENTRNSVKDFLKSLPTKEASDSPTRQQFGKAVSNFVYHNLLSEFFDQDKIFFDFIIEKQDYWPYNYDVYGKNMGLYSAAVILSIPSKNAVDLMEFIENFVG